MKSALTVVLMLGCLGALAAQEPEARKQDAEAVKLLERFDALRHVPRAAGLKDLQFAARLPSGHDLVLRWKAPDKMASELVVPADAPADRARQLQFVIPKFQAEARKFERAFLDLQLGELLWEDHKGDDVVLAAPNQVRIVAKSEKSRRTFKEQLITFDEQGLVKQARVTSPTGGESIMEPTFTQWNGKHLYQSLNTRIGTNEQTISFEYAEHGGMMLLKKVVTTTKVDGKAQAPRTLEFSDVKVNTGLDDKLFEAKPAEPKQE
jgi:hypothetical protein